jgi:hypothetical protein
LSELSFAEANYFFFLDHGESFEFISLGIASIIISFAIHFFIAKGRTCQCEATNP